MFEPRFTALNMNEILKYLGFRGQELTEEIAVQIKGKVRARIMVDADASEDELSHAAQQAVAQQLEGREIRKVIVVPGRLVNIVV